jgi:hypothetical protein
MDIGSVLRPDVYRLFIANFVPGCVALSPWAFCVISPVLLTSESWSDGGGIVLGAVLLIAAFTVGTILEDIGSRIEVSCIDARLGGAEGRCPDLDARWREYLKLCVTDDLVGQRYLRSFLVRYKFELSMVVALPVAAVGIVCAGAMGTGFDWPRTLGLVAVAIAVTVFLWSEAKVGGEALHDLRVLIIEATKESSDKVMPPGAPQALN